MSVDNGVTCETPSDCFVRHLDEVEPILLHAAVGEILCEDLVALAQSTMWMANVSALGDFGSNARRAEPTSRSYYMRT